MNRYFLVNSFCLLVLAGTAASAAELDGTLKKIADSGQITVGHRDGAVPFSYYDDNQRPIGYAMDICNAVVAAVKARVNKPELAVNTLPVTGTTRIPLLANGTIDMECGTTTNNAERQKQVTFSTTYFVAAVRIMSKKSAPVASMAELKGKTIVTLAGTTSVKIVNEANNSQHLSMTILMAKDLAEGMLTLETGRAAALIFDDVSLAGARATSKSPDAFQISDRPLSVEPYGIMLRRNDQQFKQLVNDTIAGLYQSGAINGIYSKWFTQPIPPRGINMQFPMSAQLQKTIAHPTDDANPEVYR
ncbi:transporter substrate-binding domain-containing protein [Sodalis sp. RH21]|uniref:transporter substrate-binding domain-containing protein n=1 Tax=unclassified Sodalis (in: enterobacteria) TaxID=2636512 RepID=UPI0039B5EF03